MAKTWSKALAISLSVIASAGILTGVYFGLKPAIESIVEEYTPEPEEIPSVVSGMFSELEIQSVDELTGFSSSYILSAYKVNSSSTDASVFYYDLQSASGFSGKVEFAIGITDGEVSHYSYIKNISEDSMGAGKAEASSTLFVGYSLDGTVPAGMTTSYTYAAMEKAVVAALTDAAGR